MHNPFTRRPLRARRAAPKAASAMCILGLCLVSLGSCIGIKADIAIRADGSGRIRMEYRISRYLDSLGQLDGNQGQPTVPTGRLDFERSLDRLPGLKLSSFSSKQDEKDTIVKADIDFASLDALIPFLDAAGKGASLSRAGAATRLRLTLSPGGAAAAPELLSLMEAVSQGYQVAISLSGPKETSLALFDGAGKPLQTPDGIEWVKAGKQASLAIPLGSLLSLKDGLSLEFTW